MFRNTVKIGVFENAKQDKQLFATEPGYNPTKAQIVSWSFMEGSVFIEAFPRFKSLKFGRKRLPKSGVEKSKKTTH